MHFMPKSLVSCERGCGVTRGSVKETERRMVMSQSAGHVVIVLICRITFMHPILLLFRQGMKKCMACLSY